MTTPDPESAPNATLLLISGYGRSGSTIIDIETTRCTGGISVGELRYAARHFDRGERLCSCGERVTDCPFWRSLHRDGLLSADAALADVTLLRSLWLLYRTRLPATRALFDGIARTSGRTVVIDSSKSTWGSFLRPLLVARAVEGHWRPVHLGVFRDPASVYRSMLKGRNEDLAAGRTGNNRAVAPRFIVGWLASNAALILIHHSFRRAGRASSVRELSQMTEHFDVVSTLDLPERTATSEAILHMAGGNRLLTGGAQNVLRRPSISDPDDRKAADPRWLRALAGPLYRYLRRLAGTSARL